jgi:hypothetical protein
MFGASKTKQVSSAANYIEDVFSTYLYTGTSPTDQTINNGIDLAGKGGMVWFKGRNTASGSSAQVVVDTVRGRASTIKTYTTNAAATSSSGFDLVSFNSNGFTVGEPEQVSLNNSGLPTNYASWTFRKQPKFFDVVTYTGNGNTTQAINHSLGSVPGCIIVKRIDSGTNWFVYHRGLTSYQYSLYLNDTTGQINAGGAQFGADPTSTQFTVGSGYPNTSGGQYVAYIFAHNAGGFGLTGTDNVISCGSFVNNTNTTVTLGYEPQWILVKDTSTSGSWILVDTMRGDSQTASELLYPNSSSSADAVAASYIPTATGFLVTNNVGTTGSTYIYIAIRRGPMKVPTDATKVFSPAIRNGTGATATITGLNFPPDLYIGQQRPASSNAYWCDKLRGRAAGLKSTDTNAETTSPSGSDVVSFDQNGITLGTGYNANINPGNGNSVANWMFQRAPNFFDEVCYTGTGSATTFNHNLGAIPELMIVKERDVTGAWRVYSKSIANTDYLVLNSDGVVTTGDMWNSTNPTSTVFSVGTSYSVNRPAGTFVAYLFATCPGVSKVFSYSGTGATQTISCGFTGGARFVLIKRTDSTGDWYVWDTARGMVAGTDPSLLLNSTAAEVNANSIYTTTGGFQIVSTAAGINASGGSYIGLAIA